MHFDNLNHPGVARHSEAVADETNPSPARLSGRAPASGMTLSERILDVKLGCPLEPTPESLGATAVRPRRKHFNDVAAPGHYRIDLSRDRRATVAHDGPDVRPEHHQGEFSAREVLLVSDVLIGRNQHVEGRRVRGS